MENSFIYQERIDHLRLRKFAQTREKIEVEGLLDEDDYGRVLPPANAWKSIPNHADGSFYGLDEIGRASCRERV